VNDAWPGQVWFVVPNDIDDPIRPSGGNVYDQRVRDGLAALGWDVHLLGCAGGWPWPTDADSARLEALLAEIPDAAVVLVDGLVGCAAPEVLVPEAHRLRLVPLVHMPLGSHGERELFEVSRTVITTSQWTRQRLLDATGLPGERVCAAEPGVDIADPAPGTESGKKLRCVGAGARAKGQDVLLDALTRLADLDWCLSLVGPLDREPDFVDQLRRQVVAGGVENRVSFAGTCSRAEVDKAYAEADVLVVPSRSETYGMVVTEALAHGVPVIACAVGGVREALGRAEDGSIPGLLVRAADPDALAMALRRWLADPLPRARLRRAAKMRRLTLTSWSRTTHRVAGVLAEVAR